MAIINAEFEHVAEKAFIADEAKLDGKFSRLMCRVRNLMFFNFIRDKLSEHEVCVLFSIELDVKFSNAVEKMLYKNEKRSNEKNDKSSSSKSDESNLASPALVFLAIITNNSRILKTCKVTV